MNGIDFTQLSKIKQAIQLQQLKEYESTVTPSNTASTRKAQNLINYILSNQFPANIKTKSIYYDQNNTMHITHTNQPLDLHNTMLFRASETEKSFTKVDAKQAQPTLQTHNETVEDIFPDSAQNAVPSTTETKPILHKSNISDLEKDITNIFSGKSLAKHAIPKKKMNDDEYSECYPQNYEDYNRDVQVDKGKLEEYFNSKEIQEKDDEYLEKDRVMIKAKKKKAEAHPKIDNRVRQKMNESYHRKGVSKGHM